MHAYYEDLIWFIRQQWPASAMNLASQAATPEAPLPPPGAGCELRLP